MYKSETLFRVFNWVFLFIILVLLFRIPGAWQNTLEKNGSWLSEKLLLEKKPPGAEEFFQSPLGLRGEALRLAAWNGSQEVFSKKSFSLPGAKGSLEFDFRLANDSTLLFFLRNAKGEKFGAIQFSKKTEKASFAARIDAEGKILDSMPLKELLLSGDSHHAKITWENAKTKLLIDQKPYDLPYFDPKDFQIGFRGDENPHDHVDNIYLRVSGVRKPLFVEHFSPKYSKTQSALLFCIFLLLSGVTALLSRNTRFLTNLGIVVLLFSAAYYNERIWIPQQALDLGLVVHPSLLDQALERAAEQTIVGKTKTRLALVLGDSQIAGVGASKKSSEITERAQDLLGREKLTILNFAANRSPSERLQSLWFARANDPAVSIVVFGINPVEEPNWALIQKLATSLKAKKLLFVLGPCKNPGSTNVKIFREKLMRLAAVENLSLLNLQDEIDKHKNDGLLWWDQVHLTDYGQRLFSEALVAKLQAM